MALPRFVVLKSNHNNKYLRCEDVKVKGFLQFTEEEVVSPNAKFEVVMAKSGNGLVHLRCCHNNKYWVREKPGSYWIPAAADEPEEDQSKWSCTLFKPFYVDGDTKTVRFWHVQLGHYVKLFTAGPFTSCLYAESEVLQENFSDVTIIDGECLKGRELPRYVVLKSNYNNKYLRYMKEDVQVRGFLQFSEEKVLSPYAKFEVVMAESGNGLVHLRCCYNYKYFVRQRPGSYWIVAEAKKLEEDQSNWSCTMFKPVYVDGDAKTVRFLHVQLGHYACLWRAAAPYTSCLFAGSKDPNQDLCDVCTIINWESLKRRELPRFVVLKSDYNNKYLRYIREAKLQGFLQFSEEEVLSPYVKFEVVMAKSGNGLVHLRCCDSNKYWVRQKRSSYWIVAAADEPEEDQSKWSCTLFKPVYVGGDAKIVRFLHVQLEHYACLWRAAPPYTSCLYAGSENPDKDLCDVYTIIDWESLVRRELPRFVVLKSNYNNKYLSYIQEDVKLHGLLQFSGEEVMRPYTKFEVEMAKCGNGLVHLKCCYNNKYWVRWKRNNYWVAVAADEPEEDQSKWSCTLFKPFYLDVDAKTVQFLHVQLQHYACLWSVAPPYASCLCLGSKDPKRELLDVFTVIDWESMLIMPKHVAFKGDNGNYLSARWIKGHQYLHFGSTDIGDPTVENEVFATQDGSIRIKSNYFGKFWRRSSHWIWADTDDTTNNNPDTLFWPIKVDNNVVALRNLGNNNISRRLTTEGKINCLNASVSTISREARIEVEEFVISRQICNVDFHLRDARTYNKKVLTMATEVAINKTQEPNTAEVKLSYRKTKSSTWNSSVSLKLGVKTRIQTGIPLIIEEEKINTSDEFTGAYEWGETEELTTQEETVYKITVPPMTVVTVSLLATMGSCDVPFSYSQRDTLTNGQQVTYNMDDGIYSGVNSFNFKYETFHSKIDISDSK